MKKRAKRRIFTGFQATVLFTFGSTGFHAGATRNPFMPPPAQAYLVVLMGAVRDFFKRIGVLGSVGTAIGNTGQRLLDLRNAFNRIGAKKKR